MTSANSSAVLRLGTSLLQGKRPLFAMLQAVGTQGFIAAINILTGVITARMLGPEGRGIYTAVTTWPQLLATLAFAGLNSAVVFRMRKAPDSAGRVSAGALLLGSAQCLVAITIGAALLPLFMGNYSTATTMFARLCLASALVNSTYMLMKQSFAGIGAFKSFNFANLWPQLLYLVALLVMLPLGPVSAEQRQDGRLGTDRSQGEHYQ